jgi:hypothetical protein
MPKSSRLQALKRAGIFFCFLALGLASLAGRPLDGLAVRGEDGAELFRVLLPLGREYATRYTHSVQKTPVEDYYKVIRGRIWGVREKIQSHNAGLPFAAPEGGRFRLDPPWMLVEGGRLNWPEIHLRVGGAEFGRNEFRPAAPAAWRPLYADFAGRRLTFSPAKSTLWRP